MMRKKLFFTTILLLLAALACNLPRPTVAPGQENPARKPPTATLYPVCTPPACRADEVYYCPSGCIGGCGTTCATPTSSPPPTESTPFTECTPPACWPEQAESCPFAPGITPTLAPTTQVPACTPPACAPDTIYYCPGDCPGGCGTTCATPTPEPSGGVPTIISFTADRTTITQGESVNVTWAATGGNKATLTWLGDGGTMDGIDDLPPDTGTAQIAPAGNPVTLRVSNAEGFAESTLDLTITCAHAWMPELAVDMGSKCPNEAEVGWAAQQPFEHGFMIWLEPSRLIYVFFTDYGGQSYRSYDDTFADGDPETDPNLVPPAGFLQPKRGFGKVWRENPEVRDNLGWATAPETGFDSWRQSYQGFGMHNITLWMKSIDGEVLELSPMGSVWKIYTP